MTCKAEEQTNGMQETRGEELTNDNPGSWENKKSASCELEELTNDSPGSWEKE